MKKLEKIKELSKQKNEYLIWFSWYDVQCMQYQRDIRLNGSSSIDIASLDSQAINFASKIKEIENKIKKVGEE